ncbi:TetR/AcrR family transcriptional regulator [Maridesulfovibrio sp.]|uniref:TetR/AcrR family transcriptional regulator n=1 Tax=Maridesulfovibrio sp. TaxID=2795000 RepID=UPI003BA97EBF
MARTKEFDPDKLLIQALDLFWEQGYEHTSVQDLVDHLGIGRGSMYNTFGDKRSLFLTALDHYLKYGGALLRSVLESEPAAKAMGKLFKEFINEIMSDERHRGCFVVNQMTELAPRDPEVAALLKKNQQEVIEMFRQTISSAQEQGAIHPAKDPLALAEFFYNTLIGMRVAARNNPDRDSLERIVTTALSTLND